MKPEGACRGAVCIPLPEEVGEDLDLRAIADGMGLPLIHDEESGYWCVVPEPMGLTTLDSARAPEVVLPDLEGRPFRLSALRGQKVVLLAWAPY